MQADYALNLIYADDKVTIAAVMYKMHFNLF